MIFVGEASGQSKLLPPREPGTSFGKLKVYTDGLHTSDNLYPYRVEVHRETDGAKLLVDIVKIKGTECTLKPYKGGNSFTMNLKDMKITTRSRFERFLVKGHVEEYVLEELRMAALEKARLRSLRYVRPAGNTKKEGEWRVKGSDEAHQLPFLMYEPAADKLRKPLPLIVFLHGTGGQGTDNWVQFDKDGGGAQKHFLQFTDDDWQKYMPCFMIAPQSWLPNNWWYHGEPHYPTLMITNLIDILVGRYGKKIDISRIYVTGFSGGAAGCFEMPRTTPGRFAAIVPLAGYNFLWHSFTKDMMLPCYSILNEKDPTIMWHFIHNEIDLWKHFKMEHRMVIYPGANGHDTWSKAYRDGEFRQWLQRQKLERTLWPVDASVWEKDQAPDWK